MKKTGRNFWKVLMKDEEHRGMGDEYYIQANSAGEAETIGVALAREEYYKHPYCAAAEFMGKVY